MEPNEAMAAQETEDFGDLEEVTTEEQDESESLESITGEAEDAEQPAAEEPVQGAQGTSEPGWIKQRVNKEVQKALSRQRESLMAEIDAQYAPIRERLAEMDAQELVRKGEVKSIELAREIVRYRQGQGAAPAAAIPQQGQQPRQANGQYAPKQDPATSARIDMLSHQADRIKADTGIDVIAEFSANEEIKSKVISGEMDFYDVAKQMQQKPARRKPPAPMRSPNGVNGIGFNSIESMTDAQFKMLDKKLDEGVRFTTKR